MEESLRLQEALGDPFLINRARIGLLQILVGMGELAAVEGMAPQVLTVAEELGLPAGVEVTEVRQGTPAAEAGLRAGSGSATVDGQSYPTGGDVITSIDGKAVTTGAELQTAIDSKSPGDTVSITYSRDGKTTTVEVSLGTRPS